MSADPLPLGDQWKNIQFVQSWKAGRRKSLQAKWGDRFSPPIAPLLDGVSLAASPDLKLHSDVAVSIELLQWENETLIHRARRLETLAIGESIKKSAHPSARSRHQVPVLIAHDGAGWIMAPVVSRAKDHKLLKSKRMYSVGLEKKAQRELACGLIGGEVICRSGHSFRVGYECGNRYCVTCGPRGARRLFAKHRERILFVGTRLLMCRASDSFGDCCDECSKAIEEQRFPHWPPPRGKKPRVVVAKIDFTLLNTGQAGPELMRTLNEYIKKFCRALERRFHIRRKEYGLAYCDELGGNNTNAHAHGIYIGPWLPQRKGVCELSQLWAEVTGYKGPQPRSMSGGAACRGADRFTDGSLGGGFIVSIKYARSLAEALFHAVKYPAKFAERSTPDRLAELERIFHRVRRFHALAAFYAPEVPDPPDPPERRCPLCDDQLSVVKLWQTLAELERRGLRDLSAVKLEVARARGLTGAGPPLVNTFNCDLPAADLPASKPASA